MMVMATSDNDEVHGCLLAALTPGHLIPAWVVAREIR